MNGVKPSETMTVFYKTIVITDEEELFNLWEEWERDQFTSCDVAWALANESWSLGITKKDKPLIQNELAVFFCVLRSPRFGAGERVRSFVRRPSECDRSVTHAGCCSEGCEIGVGPSVVLFAIRRACNGPRTVQPVIALATNLCVVVRPLCLLQLIVKRGICYHVTIGERVIVHSIETAVDHFVGRIRAKQDALPACNLLRWLFVIRFVLAARRQ